jgi:hypothetical protein
MDKETAIATLRAHEGELRKLIVAPLIRCITDKVEAAEPRR